MDFIHSQGFSTQQVNEFASKGLPIRNVNDRDMFDKSPQRNSNSDAKLKEPILGVEGTVPMHNICAGCVVPGLEEGELLCSPIVTGDLGISTVAGSSPIMSAKPSWSFVVAQGEPRSILKLIFFLLPLKMGQS